MNSDTDVIWLRLGLSVLAIVLLAAILGLGGCDAKPQGLVPYEVGRQHYPRIDQILKREARKVRNLETEMWRRS